MTSIIGEQTGHNRHGLRVAAIVMAGAAALGLGVVETSNGIAHRCTSASDIMQAPGLPESVCQANESLRDNMARLAGQIGGAAMPATEIPFNSSAK